MSATIPATGAGGDDRLGGMAARLIDIAGCVAQEAEVATGAMRGLVDQAERVEMLAARLSDAAGAIEDGVRAQTTALAAARADLATNKPVIDALETSIADVAAISDIMAALAKESHTLSLNARIEAARAGSGSSAFAAVASEMSTLAGRSKRATDRIGHQSVDIASRIRVANQVALGYGSLVQEQDLILAHALEQAATQRRTSQEMVTITTDIADIANGAASAIGRVGAAVIAVKVLARQLSQLRSA